MKDAFISHASEDKDTIAIPLAHALHEYGIDVWLDKFILKAGDNLAKSIQDGLSESRYGIVVLSEAFFAKEWTRKELEIIEENEQSSLNRLIPIWHEIGDAFVRRFSTSLADRVGIQTNKGLPFVVHEVIKCMLQDVKRSDKGFVTIVHALQDEINALINRMEDSEDFTLPRVKLFKGRIDSDLDNVMGIMQEAIDRLEVFLGSDHPFIKMVYASKERLIDAAIDLAMKQTGLARDKVYYEKHHVFLWELSEYFRNIVKVKAISHLTELVDILSSLESSHTVPSAKGSI